MMGMPSPHEESILRSLRKVSRAIDLYSRQLVSRHQLTGPQLVCLRHLLERGPTTPSALARGVSLSHATVTGILTRLEARRLVERTRSDEDRRRVIVTLTEEGEALAKTAPSPLQDRFATRLAELPAANQAIIDTVLLQIVEMMGAEELDASPLLTTGPVDADVASVGELLGAQEEEGSSSPRPAPPAPAEGQKATVSRRETPPRTRRSG